MLLSFTLQGFIRGRPGIFPPLQGFIGKTWDIPPIAGIHTGRPGIFPPLQGFIRKTWDIPPIAGIHTGKTWDIPPIAGIHTGEDLGYSPHCRDSYRGRPGIFPPLQGFIQGGGRRPGISPLKSISPQNPFSIDIIWHNYNKNTSILQHNYNKIRLFYNIITTKYVYFTT